jgi:hypothetical protein
MTGLHVWTRGYCVSTVGYDETAVRQYIQEQEQQNKHQSEFHIDNQKTEKPRIIICVNQPGHIGFLLISSSNIHTKQSLLSDNLLFLDELCRLK